MLKSCNLLALVTILSMASMVSYAADPGASFKNVRLTGPEGEVSAGATVTVKGTVQSGGGGQIKADDVQSGSAIEASIANKVPLTRTVNGHALSADVTVSKSDVGLGNADNTSDANKPISTATQAALDTKAPTASPTFTGSITLGTFLADSTRAEFVSAGVHAGLTPTSVYFADATKWIGITASGFSMTNSAISMGAWDSSTGALYAAGGLSSGANSLTLNGKVLTAPAASGTLISSSDTGTVTNGMLANSSITIAGTSTSLGDSISLDTIDNGIAANGLIVRTGANARVARTITAGTGMSVSNGDGVSGNPTVTLGNTAVSAGTYGSSTTSPAITVDAQGRVTNAVDTVLPQSYCGISNNSLRGFAAADWRPVMASAPTVTTALVSDTNSTTETGSTFISFTDKRLTYEGCLSVGTGSQSNPTGGITGGNNTPASAVEFVLRDSWFELFSRSEVFPALRVYVDGELINDNYGFIGPTGSGIVNGSLGRTKFVFPTVAQRRIRIESGSNISGFRVGSNSALASSTSGVRKLTAMVVGDSLVEGTGAFGSAGSGSFGYWIGRKFGWNMFNSGSGSTGYAATTAGRYNYIGRIQDVAAVQPDVLIVWGSINDGLLTTEPGDYYDAVRHVSPHTKIIVIGIFWPTTPFGGTAANNVTIAAACAARGIPFINPVVSGREWFTSQNTDSFFGGTTATMGTVTLSGGGIATVPVSTGGTQYCTPYVPITISGDGTGAYVLGNVALVVSSLNIIDPGSGIANGTYSWSGSNGSSGTITASGGGFTSYTITSGGSTVTTPPTITVSGVSTTANWIISSHVAGPIASTTVVRAGSGFTTATATAPSPSAGGPHFNEQGHEMVGERAAHAIELINAGITTNLN